MKSVLAARWRESLGDYVLYWDGGDILGIDRWGNLESLLRKPSQQLLHVLAIPIAQWRTEVESEARSLPVVDLKRPPSASARTPTRKLAS